MRSWLGDARGGRSPLRGNTHFLIFFNISQHLVGLFGNSVVAAKFGGIRLIHSTNLRLTEQGVK